MVDRVLLVENDELFGVLVELALREAGYAVARVRNGAEALSLLNAKTPAVDLLITDVGLGDGLDGWQVARHARAELPELPVIYTTGARADEWRSEHVPFGVLLLKPFAVHQLVEMAGALMAARAEAGGMQRSA